MSISWKKEKFENVVSFVNNKIETEKLNLFNYISTENLLPNRGGVVAATSLPDIKRVNYFREGDILFSNIRTYFKKVWFCRFEGGASNDVIIFRTKNDNILDSKFLYYIISGDAFIDTTIVSSKGTKMPRGDKDAMMNYELTLPSLRVQQKIASILSAYDDLIEINNKRIKILEEMAQLIYREWFVKFKFPGHENVKMKDGVPEEWEEVKVEDALKRIQSGKKYDNKTAKPTGKVPILDQGRSGVIGYHDDEPGVIASEENPIIVFANHTCYQNLIMFPFSAIQNILPFYPSDKYKRNIFWLHWATKDLIELNDYKGHWPEFVAKKLLVPSADVCEEFGELIKPMFVLKYKLERLNNNLRQTRDLLLPKLMSGEIEIR